MVVGTLWSWFQICGWTCDVVAVVLAASVFGTVWLWIEYVVGTVVVAWVVFVVALVVGN